MRIRRSLAVGLATVALLTAGSAIPAEAATKSGNLACGSRLLAAQATGYYNVTAVAAGVSNSANGSSPHTVNVISGSHSGAWSGNASPYLDTANTFGYCY